MGISQGVALQVVRLALAEQCSSMQRSGSSSDDGELSSMHYWPALDRDSLDFGETCNRWCTQREIGRRRLFSPSRARYLNR